jgi:hypothetical protein
MIDLVKPGPGFGLSQRRAQGTADEIRLPPAGIRGQGLEIDDGIVQFGMGG